MNKAQWLKFAETESPSDSERLAYSIDQIKINSKLKLFKLPQDSYLVLNWENDDLFLLRFAVLDFCSSNVNDTDIRATMVFHGCGFSGNLRECRHTYWGEDGYLFYPNGKVITAAFKILSEFFDGMI